MATREDMTVQERIAAALELAERICDQCRPRTAVWVDGVCPECGGTPGNHTWNCWTFGLLPGEAFGTRIESGPQSEAQFEEQMREMYPGWGEAE